MRFFDWIARFAIVLFIAGCAGEKSQQQVSIPKKPNIIFIMADDLGIGDVGAYGQNRIRTPHIDRMAREGILFRHAYAGSTVCAPSRSVVMTGQHTGRTPIRGNKEVYPMGQQPLPDSSVTVAEVLKQAGYTTGLVGKWGLGMHDTEGAPLRQGFDYSFGYLCQRHAHNYYPEFLFRNGERVPLDNVVSNDRLDGAGVAVEKRTYSHSLIEQEALSFIEKNRNKPFFLYFTPTLPHANNEGGESGMEVPDQGPYVDESWPENEKNFAAMVTLLDASVGAVLEKVRELGIAENTLVIFTSDNGPHREGGHDPEFFNSNGPFTGIKRSLNEGGIRIPFIAWWPKTIEGGRRSDHVTYHGDFMATAAALAGVRPPRDIQSISIVPVLRDEDGQRIHDYLYWEFGGNHPQQAVRIGKWKAIQRSGNIEVYDLTKDPAEQHDIADQNPDVVKRAQEAMREAAGF